MPEVETGGLGSLEILDEKISEVEIKAIIKNWAREKAPDATGSGMKSLKRLSKIWHFCWQFCSTWCYKGVSIPILGKNILHPIFTKKGSPREVSNYRGVGLLTSFQKIFNKIIQQRLYRWSEENKIFPKCDWEISAQETGNILLICRPCEVFWFNKC